MSACGKTYDELIADAYRTGIPLEPYPPGGIPLECQREKARRSLTILAVIVIAGALLWK